MSDKNQILTNADYENYLAKKKRCREIHKGIERTRQLRPELMDILHAIRYSGGSRQDRHDTHGMAMEDDEDY